MHGEETTEFPAYFFFRVCVCVCVCVCGCLFSRSKIHICIYIYTYAYIYIYMLYISFLTHIVNIIVVSNRLASCILFIISYGEHAFWWQIIQGVCAFGLQGIHVPREKNDDSRLLSQSFCSATL